MKNGSQLEWHERKYSGGFLILKALIIFPLSYFQFRWLVLEALIRKLLRQGDELNFVSDSAISYQEKAITVPSMIRSVCPSVLFLKFEACPITSTKS